MRIAVIGGGITGLAAAWQLQQFGRTVEVLLLDKSARLGGCIRTEHHQGFTIEHGPDVFLARKPETMALCAELGVPTEETSRQHRGVFIRRGDSLHRLPEGLSGLIPTRLGPLLTSDLLSVKGRLRVLLDLILPRHQENRDESVAAFFTRRLGKEAFTSLIEPVLAGITGGQADILSMNALFPGLRAIEHRYGSLLLGLSNSESSADEGASLRSIPGGLSRLVDTLQARLGAIVYCGTDVSSIARDQQSWHVHTAGQAPVQTHAIILAVPAWSAASLVTALDPLLANELAAIPHNATVVVNLAFQKARVSHPLNGYGYLVSRQEASPVTACTWSSSKLMGRAPDGHVLLRVFLAGKETVELSDEAIKEAAMRELRVGIGVNSGPLFVRIQRYAQAMPQYVLGHGDRMERISRRLAQHDGLYIAGPMKDGVGIADCVRNGRTTANSALSRIRHNLPE